MEQTDSGQRGVGRGIIVKEGEGTIQRTGRNDPRSWTVVGVGGGGCWGERRAKSEKLGQL